MRRIGPQLKIGDMIFIVFSKCAVAVVVSPQATHVDVGWEEKRETRRTSGEAPWFKEEVKDPTPDVTAPTRVRKKWG